MQLTLDTLDENELLKGSEDLHRKLDEILAFIREKVGEVEASHFMEYYKDKETITLELNLSLSVSLRKD